MDYRKVYAENEADITAFAKENNIDIHNLADRRQLVKDWASATGYTVQKPNWFKRMISNIRIWFHNHGIMIKHFSDDDIANIIYRSAKAARDRRRTASRDGDGVRFLAFDEQGQYFPAPDVWGTAYTSMTGKGLQAIEFLLEKKNGFVPAAFHRQEIGDIDIVYGKTGYGIDDDGGYGLAHIEKRRGKGHVDWQVFADTINNGKLVPKSDTRVNLINNKSKVIVELNYNGIDRKWVVSAMGNDLTSTADSLLASNPAEAAKQGIAPKGLYNIGDDLDFFKFSDEKNPENASSTDKNGPSAAPDGAMEGKRTETDRSDKSDYSDKSDGNGALFTLNSNASEELKLQVKAMQDCVGPFLDQDGAEYARRFKEKYGITIDPDEAIVIAQLAISENRSARQKYVAAQNAVNAWSYFKSFNPLFDFIVEFGQVGVNLNAYKFG